MALHAVVEVGGRGEGGGDLHRVVAAGQAGYQRGVLPGEQGQPVLDTTVHSSFGSRDLELPHLTAGTQQFIQTLGFTNRSLGFSCTDFGFTARQFLRAISKGKSEP